MYKILFVIMFDIMNLFLISFFDFSYVKYVKICKICKKNIYFNQ